MEKPSSLSSSLGRHRISWRPHRLTCATPPCPSTQYNVAWRSRMSYARTQSNRQPMRGDNQFCCRIQYILPGRSNRFRLRQREFQHHLPDFDSHFNFNRQSSNSRGADIADIAGSTDCLGLYWMTWRYALGSTKTARSFFYSISSN